MELSASELWSQILDEARTALPEQAFRTWLAPTEAISVSSDTLIVSTPNPFAVQWVEDKYADLLAGISERLYGTRFRLSVQFSSGGSPVDGPGTLGIPLASPPQLPTPRDEDRFVGAPTETLRRPATPLNERYTFDRFVVGHNNQLAAAAAHAVAEAPARMYNPLFIYGGVGLGKTHLMHAIGHAVVERAPHKRVLYLSSETFTNELIGAIQGGSMAEFRRMYRQIDLLLVDDIQFLEGKRQTQEEFFHTFNALHDAQRQIVLTSDRPPKDIGLEDRLVSRFEWGLVTDIQLPDFETRVAILRKRAQEDGLEISGMEEVLNFIARHCTSSVRELEGAVIKLLAYSSLTRREINVDLAQEALGGVLRSPQDPEAQQLTPDLVRRKVSSAWGVSPEQLQSKKRTKDLTVPRQIAMYLIKEHFDLSLVEIGKLFGGRDHSTVIHSINKVEEQLGADEEFRQKIDELRRGL
ncbi:MAG: chromosomal replication initiator protein DnaA [Gemmatimonas sp.]|nr:chromosomal replication initiator protein DnaA [Gemmatimonas sp.]